MNMEDRFESNTIKDSDADSICTRITEPACVHNTIKEYDPIYLVGKVLAGFREMPHVGGLDCITYKEYPDRHLRLFATSRQINNEYVKVFDLWDMLTPEELINA